MVLAAVHPGVEVETVRTSTGWPLRLDPQLTRTPSPTREELESLRRFDPHGFWTGRRSN
jgi:glutaconate CoA-transferase subunit B